MTSLKLQAYTLLKQKIIQCEYPPNALLNEEKLKEELKMSRTPIRDALGRLEQESLIRILPRRGIMVRGISLEEVEHNFEIRMLIEPYALKTYGKTIDRTALMEFKHHFSQDSEGIPYDIIHKQDDDFHHLFINASKNNNLIEAYRFGYTQSIRLRILSGNLGKDRISKSQQEHYRIICYCLENKWEKAADELTEHLRFAKLASCDIINNLQIFLRQRY